MALSVAVELIIAAAAVAAVLGHAKKAPLRVVLRYFTALSNLLCAAASLAVALCRLFGCALRGVLALRFAGTASVTLTLLTVLAFLGPTIGYRRLLTGPDFWLHLFCPILALVSHFVWDRPALSLGAAAALSALPLALYSAMYIYRVLYAPEDKRWKDFYGFNRGGKWPLSLAIMLAGSVLIGAALWAL